MVWLQLFVKYNIHFAGLSRSIFGGPGNYADGTDFAELVAEIGSMSFESTNLHWRYRSSTVFCKNDVAFSFTKCIVMIISVDSHQPLDTKRTYGIRPHSDVHP